MLDPVPNLRHLAGIVGIAETGTLSAAADRISLSQPALTQGLSRIEARLGIALFQRIGTGMKPTEPGELYVRRLRRGFGFLQRAARAVGRPHLWQLVTVAQLRALIAAIERGGFRPAAIHLGQRVSTISRACRDLETLGETRFFETTSRGLSPRRQAETFTQLAQLALNEFRQAERDVRGWQGSFEGRLDIGCLPLAQTAILPAAQNAFALEYPGIAQRVVDGLYRALARDLLRGTLDLMIGALRGSDLPDGLTQAELFADHLWIVARPGHPLEGVCDLGEADLALFPWVAPRAGAPARAQFDRLHGVLARAPGVPSPIETGSHSVMKGLLIGSDRLTVVSRMQVKHEVSSGALIRLDAPVHDEARSIGYTHRNDWMPSVPQARFLDILRETVARA
ncbi:LysR family transcriptional regulator [Palleronia sp.]|uniref:LysR family transcriptional regulator n=1 Tax=Palleronia sp. TaxID=1940284 RepID=UPI0035C7D911